MKLIIGLGNPGPEYAATRHNTGFMAVDALAAEWGGNWQEKSRFKAVTADAEADGQKVLLVKPTTYYNLSGEAVRAILDFYKIPAGDVLVIHDELALAFGTIRARVGGSDAGNNGIKSLILHIGADFARVRVGIANEQLPVIGAHDFVLGRFAESEKAVFTGKVLPQVAGFAADFVDSGKPFAHHSVSIA